MIPSLRRKLEALIERREEVERLLSDPGTISDAERFRDLSREFSQLEPVATALAAEGQARRDLANAEAMRSDPELRELAEEEIAAASARLRTTRHANCSRNSSRRTRATKAISISKCARAPAATKRRSSPAICIRMYARFAERQGWRVEVESANPGEHGGFREIVARIEGRGAYSKLKFESGTHRVQRVPETESQGRIHTSAATVAIIAEEAPACRSK